MIAPYRCLCRYLWTILLLSGLGSCVRSSPPVAVATPAFDASRAMGYLKSQMAMGPRYAGTSGHSAMRTFLRKHFEALHFEVEEQRFTIIKDNEDLSFANILVRQKDEKRPRTILAAHWDTRPFSDQDPLPEFRSTPLPGANDGASGVAVLMELANAFAKQAPQTAWEIVLFDGEDFGRSTQGMFLGSRHFASVLSKADYKEGILIDMIGDKNLNILMEQNSLHYAPDLVKRVWERAKELNLSAFVDRAGYTISDDHLPLNEAGIPCIDIIDFDYPYWHTTEDTTDKVSAESLSIVGKLLVSLMYN